MPRRLLLLGIFYAGLAAFGQAALLTYQFTGSYVSQSSTFDVPDYSAATVSGTFSYDTSWTPAGIYNGQEAIYFVAPTHLAFSVVGYTPMQPSIGMGQDPFFYAVINDLSSPSIDGFALISGDYGEGDQFILRLAAPTTFWSTFDLPSALDLADFTLDPYTHIQWRDGYYNVGITFSVDSLTLIPEPDSWSYLGCALLLGCLYGVFRKRSHEYGSKRDE